MRNLILVLGDQLDHQSAAFDGFDVSQDAVWMAENHEEATHVWSHKQRLVLFFSAMRHFRDELREKDYSVHYYELTSDPEKDAGSSFADILKVSVKDLKPERLIVVQPGDYRVQQSLMNFADKVGIQLEIRPDQHFYCSLKEFADWADGRNSLVLETFYRHMRKKHGVLVEEDGDPTGGDWNYDEDNRHSFKKSGPGDFSEPHAFRMDELTQEVCAMVEQRFADHPGLVDDFNLPVTHTQSLQMLRDFAERQLPLFGRYEDAMWTDEAFLYHSRLSAPLNVKLLSPRACVEKALDAYTDGHAPINSVEGFVRQILGWREFVRGIYWLHMPDYAEKNHFRHQADVPQFYWDGETDMHCVKQSMQHVLRYGYSHHIHRLMVLGNLALLLGVHPKEFNEWHMAMYVDAIDWVSLPNAFGMSQHGDGGIVGTKPYVSTGNYINKMSNFCSGCRYNHKKAAGEDACPFTALYWDFLDRHEKQFSNNHRMGMQLKNLERKREKEEFSEIIDTANRYKDELLS